MTAYQATRSFEENIVPKRSFEIENHFLSSILLTLNPDEEAPVTLISVQTKGNRAEQARFRGGKDTWGRIRIPTRIQGRVFVLSVARSSSFCFSSSIFFLFFFFPFFFSAGNQRVGTRARTTAAPEDISVERRGQWRQLKSTCQRGKG